MHVPLFYALAFNDLVEKPDKHQKFMPNFLIWSYVHVQGNPRFFLTNTNGEGGGGGEEIVIFQF